MEQAVQIVGAVIILTAFVLAQQHRLANDSVTYLALNAVGAGILAVVAVLDGDLGFMLLEGTWAIVSTVGLARCLRPAKGPAL